jgi:telomere length regulation protein
VALKWAAALLRHVDEPQHGIDLLGRDHFLLGKLLVTLGALRCEARGCWASRQAGGPGGAEGDWPGHVQHALQQAPAPHIHTCAGSFLEASAQTTEAVTLAAATLELMRCGRVHAHPEPYVRRAALLAAGHVLGAVPPARLASAMLGAAAGGGGGARATAADEALVPRLEWLRSWVEGVARQDTDDSCRCVFGGGVVSVWCVCVWGGGRAGGGGRPGCCSRIGTSGARCLHMMGSCRCLHTMGS